MKKILLLVLAMVFFFPIVVFASDISLSVKGGIYVPIDKELQNGYTLQANLQWKAVYVFGQYLETQRRIGGQVAGITTIYGIGTGLSIPVNQYLNVWGQFGYYLPQTDLTDGKLYKEAHNLCWRKWGHDHNYNVGAYSYQYDYKIQGALGGSFGADIKYPLSKHLETSLSTGYTFLKFPETFYARAPGWTQEHGWIQTIQDKDYSGFTMGIQVTYTF